MALLPIKKWVLPHQIEAVAFFVNNNATKQYSLTQTHTRIIFTRAVPWMCLSTPAREQQCWEQTFTQHQKSHIYTEKGELGDAFSTICKSTCRGSCPCGPSVACGHCLQDTGVGWEVRGLLAKNSQFEWSDNTGDHSVRGLITGLGDDY